MARVQELLQEVSATCSEPRFGHLAPAESWEKMPGEVVTVADEESEAMLTERLPALFPAPVVGEEGCARDPATMSALGADWAWVVDPVDGTANFAAGRPDWAVMVALLRSGSAVMGWIWLPVSGRMYVAERGSGATANGSALARPSAEGDPAKLRGVVPERLLPDDYVAKLRARRRRLADVSEGLYCAGAEYPALVEGHRDFINFWRGLPWDHAPGALLAEEAGCTVRHLDGTPYRAGVVRTGLLAAAGDGAWDAACSALWGEV